MILSRVVGSPAAPVSHRVIVGGWASLDASLLDRAGGEGFRLCGIALDEEPPNPALVVSDRHVPASNDVEEDPLPPVGRSGAVDAEALEVLGNHLTRHHGSEPSFARIRKGPNGTFVLATVVT